MLPPSTPAKTVWPRDAETRTPGFEENAHRQSLAAAAADRKDKDLTEFTDAAWTDLDE